jgi:hypothetical protein
VRRVAEETRFLCRRIGLAGSPLFEKPVEILSLEAEATSVAKLRRRDGALPRPAPDRLLVHAEVDYYLRDRDSRYSDAGTDGRRASDHQC